MHKLALLSHRNVINHANTATAGSGLGHKHHAAAEASTAVPAVVAAPAAVAGSRRNKVGCTLPQPGVPAGRPLAPAKWELEEEQRAARSQLHVRAAGEGVTDDETDGGEPLEGTGTVGLGSDSRPGS